MRDELLNATLFFTTGQARSILDRWIDDYNTERPRSSLGYVTREAFATGLEPALMRDDSGRSLIAAG